MSSQLVFELPSIGDHKDVPIVDVFVKPGDRVSVDDPLIALESEKATLEVPSPHAGRIVEVRVEVGRKVSQGVPVCVIELDAVEAAPDAAPAKAAEPAPAEAAAPPPEPPAAPPEPTSAPRPRQEAPAGAPAGRQAHATPSVRAFARELGVDLDGVAPTGPKGRILREDLLAFVKGRMAAPAPAGSGLPPMPAFDHEKHGPVERVPLSRIQRISGAALHRNWVNIPHVTNFDEADTTELEAFRTATNAERRDPPVKLTMVAFLIKASAIALARHPRFNASLDGDAVVLKKYVHIGFAVDTPNGLMVPVVRDCDRKGLLEIAREMTALSEKARQGKLQPRDMEGGCFSVSSLGGIGGTGFTPIINAPEVAILGAARSQTLPRWDGKAFQPRLVTPLSLSWDHRVVDGVAAARFLGDVSHLLGDFRRATL